MVEEQARQSMLTWIVQSSGVLGLLVVLSGVLVFFGALILVFATRRPSLVAAGFAWLLLPLWLGGIGMLLGSLQSFMVIAFSEVAPRPKDLAEGVSVALVCPLLALVLTFPSYLVLVTGLFLRTLGAGKQPDA